MYVVLNYRAKPSGLFRLDIVTLTGHGLADRGIGVRNQAARRDFYLSKTSVLAPGSTNPPVQWGVEGVCHGVEAAGV
jgi:hypothetical protein